MSKAFTREDDQAPERGFVPKLTPIPPGVKNYITADGAAKLQNEWTELETTVRPRLEKDKEDPETARELELVQQRLSTLAAMLGSVTLVEPTGIQDKVIFGSWVRVRHQDRSEEVYRIVGIYETELSEAWISWICPLAKALINRGVGEKVKLKLPKGMDELEIMEISDLPLK